MDKYQKYLFAVYKVDFLLGAIEGIGIYVKSMQNVNEEYFAELCIASHRDC